MWLRTVYSAPMRRAAIATAILGLAVPGPACRSLTPLRLAPSQPMHGDRTLVCEGGELRVNGAAVPSGEAMKSGLRPGDEVSCAGKGASRQATVTGGNILLVITDDQGTDFVGAYGENTRPVRTPHMDQLAAEGVLFRRAYANPLCAPTRAALLTGQHVFRTGFGYGVRLDHGEDLELDPGLPTLPKILKENRPDDYRAVALGKWNLSLIHGRPSDRGPGRGAAWLESRPPRGQRCRRVGSGSLCDDEAGTTTARVKDPDG